jgi:hypothetical protein
MVSLIPSFITYRTKWRFVAMKIASVKQKVLVCYRAISSLLTRHVNRWWENLRSKRIHLTDGSVDNYPWGNLTHCDLWSLSTISSAMRGSSIDVEPPEHNLSRVDFQFDRSHFRVERQLKRWDCELQCEFTLSRHYTKHLTLLIPNNFKVILSTTTNLNITSI